MSRNPFSAKILLRLRGIFRKNRSAYGRIATLVKKKKKEEETLWDERMQLVLTIPLNVFEILVLSGNCKPSTSMRIVLCKVVDLSFKQCYSWLVQVMRSQQTQDN